jgi:hypothetical protein
MKSDAPDNQIHQDDSKEWYVYSVNIIRLVPGTSSKNVSFCFNKRSFLE